jgi:hypothetical protein
MSLQRSEDWGCAVVGTVDWIELSGWGDVSMAAMSVKIEAVQAFVKSAGFASDEIAEAVTRK